MWTPKRVLLLSAGIAVFVTGYLVYAFFLGGIDGMPPLPQDFLADISGEPGEVAPPPESDIVKKLTLAFGKDSDELKRRMKFEIRKKGMVVAARDIKFNEPDGRVKLEDFSVAIFKDPKDGKPPEINTITSDLAYLKFNIPIKDPTDMQKGELVGGELCSDPAIKPAKGIKIINNRRTPCPETHDDLEVYMPKGPLLYDGPKSIIWTEDLVQLLDLKTQPHPTKITGIGMEMLLARDKPGDKKQPAGQAHQKAKSDLGGVEVVTLKSSVEMHLYPGATSSFPLPGPGTPPVKDADKVTQDKTEVTIRTEGPFVYDMINDIATFASPQGTNGLEQVEVKRRQVREKDKKILDEKCDQLICDLLTIKFRRGTQPANGAGTGSVGSDREIESAKATARPKSEVVVATDSEDLHCICRELTYQCPTSERGARTILRGEPLEACKAGSKIITRQITLVSAKENKAGQPVSANDKGHMIAEGPGIVHLFDAKTQSFTTHAEFKGLLKQITIKEGDRELDQLTLTEDAAFIEDDLKGPDGRIVKAGQKLYGQKLQVYLDSKEPPSKATPAEPKGEASAGGAQQKPVRVEAYDKVRAEAADLRIENCDIFFIRFIDVAPSTGVLPGPQPASPASPAPVGLAALPPAGGGPLPSVASGTAGPLPAASGAAISEVPAKKQSAADDKSKDKDAPKKPTTISAHAIKVEVLRSPDKSDPEKGDKNDLQQLVAEGKVHVHQDGETPQDKGIDIVGETLNLNRYPEGDTLLVFGDPRTDATKYAQLQLHDIYLAGPMVTMKQKENTVKVDGIGVMTMPSNTALDGTKSTKPGSILIVTWMDDMLFNGSLAEFSGGVVARQNDSTLQCNNLLVELDRAISFKAGPQKEEKQEKRGKGDKDDKGAKVQSVLAYGKVCVLDEVKDEKDATKISQMSRLECHELKMDNPPANDPNGTTVVIASGPGAATILNYGTPEELGASKEPSKAPSNLANKGKAQTPAKSTAKPEQLMRTKIDFQDRMLSTQQSDKTRKSTFMGNVIVVYGPGDSFDSTMDIADQKKLPKGALVVYCSRMIVDERPRMDPTTGKPKMIQTMTAETKVRCMTNDMTAIADSAVFDKEKNVIVFKGVLNNPAFLAKTDGPPGMPAQTFTGQTIHYDKKTGLATVEGSAGISGELAPADRFQPISEYLLASR